MKMLKTILAALMMTTSVFLYPAMPDAKRATIDTKDPLAFLSREQVNKDLKTIVFDGNQFFQIDKAPGLDLNDQCLTITLNLCTTDPEESSRIISAESKTHLASKRTNENLHASFKGEKVIFFDRLHIEDGYQEMGLDDLVILLQFYCIQHTDEFNSSCVVTDKLMGQLKEFGFNEATTDHLIELYNLHKYDETNFTGHTNTLKDWLSKHGRKIYDAALAKLRLAAEQPKPRKSCCRWFYWSW